MYYDLLKLKQAMDVSNYSLKDLALYYEKFDGYICEILTNFGLIKFKFTVEVFPHLIGMQYAFKFRKNKHEYKGVRGFNKVKNGEVTYEDMKKNIKNNPKSNFSWKNIDMRIRFLPMFLNSITNKALLRTSIGNNDPERSTHIKGSYFLYRELHDGKTPMLSLKRVNKTFTVIETFIVDDDKSIIRNLQQIRIKSIKLIAPLQNITPMMDKDEQLEKV